MYQTSEVFNGEILKTSRRFKARITTGEKIFQDEILTMTINLGSCGDTAFSFGTVFSSYAEIVLADTGQFLAGQELFIEIGLYLQDNTIEYVPLGYFTASSENISKTQGKISLKAADRFSACQSPYKARISYPAKIGDVLNDISAQTGIVIATSLNVSGTINKMPSNTTCLDLLGDIAGLLGSFCCVDRAGIVRINSFPSTVTREVLEQITMEHSFEEGVYKVGKISVSVGDDADTVYTDSDGLGNGIAVENPYITQPLFDSLKNKLIGYMYHPGTLSFLGDPRLDATDMISITIDGETKTVPCMNIVHDFDGGLTTTVTAPGRSASDERLKGPLQIQVEKARKAAEQAKYKANLAEEVSNQAKQQAENAKSAADEALASASEAQTKADNAVSNVGDVKKDVAEITETVASAKKTADDAWKAADIAKTDAATARASSENAEAAAGDAKTAASDAQTKADSAIESAETAKDNASEAKSAATEASKTASAAKAETEQARKDIDNLSLNLTTVTETMEANYAKKTELTESEAKLQSQISKNAAEISSTVNKVSKIDETANNAADLAATAQTKAEAAQTKADQATSEAAAAQTKADEASLAAQTAQSNADTAKAAAENAQSVADKAKTDLAEAQKNLATVKGRVDATEGDIAKAQKAVTTAQAAAEKAQSNANAAATKASSAQDVADAAKSNASLAQTAANQASAKAEAAQTIANEAKVNASDAQEKAADAVKTAGDAKTAANNAAQTASDAQDIANAAKANATAAQAAADDAKKKSDQAAADLVTAKKNLEEVFGRVDSTAEEVEAAKTAVATAQAAADKAKADAATAQSTANTAKTNASNAQKAADTAKTAADNAKKAANDAQKAADKAQDDVNALTKRVVNAETSIKQNSEAVALGATKTEVTEAADATLKSAKTYADAQIKVTADGINKNVSKVQAASIISSQEQFYQSTSPTSLTGGSWSNTQPAWANGKYIWRRTLVTYGNNKTGYTPSETGVCITGNTGATGSTGLKALQPLKSFTGTYTTIGYTASENVTSFNRTPVVGDTFINLDASSNTGTWQVTTVSNGTATFKLLSCVSSKGSKGDPGATGKGIKSTAVTYQASSSGTTVPTGTWVTSVPTVFAGKYLWTRTIITYTDNTTSTSYSVGKMGRDGSVGAGGNLIQNGYGEFLDNTNFSGGTFTKGDCPEGAYGYFTYGQTNAIPFDAGKIYDLEFYVRKHAGASGENYFSICPLDIDGNEILFWNVLTYNKNLFYLAKDLNVGDTIVYFKDLSKWNSTTTAAHQRSFLFFGYQDSTGYTYPDGTYSRYLYLKVYADNSSVNLTNNTITLTKAWNGRTFKAGTCVGQPSDGSSHCYYGQTGSITNTTWSKRNATVFAGDGNGKYAVDFYSLRLSYAKYIYINLWNKVADYSKLSLREHDSTVDNVNDKLTELRQEVNSNIEQTGEAIKSSVYEKVYLKDDVDTLLSSVNTEVEQTKTSWQVTFNQLVKQLNDYSDGSDAAFDEIRKYIRFEDGNILLGNSSSPLILRIRNDRIQFLQNGYEVAYISDQRMYNTTCEIVNQLRIADSAWTIETNSNGDTIVSLIGL